MFLVETTDIVKAMSGHHLMVPLQLLGYQTMLRFSFTCMPVCTLAAAAASQDKLGEAVFVDVPEVNDEVTEGGNGL